MRWRAILVKTRSILTDVQQYWRRDFPAVAVFLTDAGYTGEELDADIWQATLHIEIFYRRRYPIPSSMTGWSHVFIRCLAMCGDFLC